MPFFTPTLNLKKPTESEQLTPEDYNDNMDIIDQSVNDYITDGQAHGLEPFESIYKLNKDASGKFTEIQWKRPDGTLAKKMVLSGRTPPHYVLKTVTHYRQDGITVTLIT